MSSTSAPVELGDIVEYKDDEGILRLFEVIKVVMERGEPTIYTIEDDQKVVFKAIEEELELVGTIFSIQENEHE